MSRPCQTKTACWMERGLQLQGRSAGLSALRLGEVQEQVGLMIRTGQLDGNRATSTWAVEGCRPAQDISRGVRQMREGLPRCIGRGRTLSFVPKAHELLAEGRVIVIGLQALRG
jgi:hypothetical protein